MTGTILHLIPAAKKDLQDIWYYTAKNWGESQQILIFLLLKWRVNS